MKDTLHGNKVCTDCRHRLADHVEYYRIKKLGVGCTRCACKKFKSA